MAAKAKKKGGSFVKQAAILAAASLLVRFLGFIYRWPLTNMIGDEGNAIYAGGYYIYTFLLILSSAGLPAAISKLVSERIALKQYRNAHRVFQAALVISTSLGVFFALVMGLGAHRLANMIQIPDSYYSLLTLCPTLVIVAIMSVFRGYFQGMRTMVPTAISQVVEQIFNAFFSVYLAWVFMSINIPEGMTKNIPLASAGGTMGTGVGALAGLVVVVFAYCLIRPYLLWRAERCKQPYEETKRELMGRVLQTAWPIIAGTAVFSITNLIDMGMVVRILQQIGFSEVDAKALYGQLSLTTLPVTISTAVATAALPSIATSVKLKEKKQVRRKMALTYRISMIISVPAAVGISALGPQIIHMLFPSASDGGTLLTVGGVSIIFLALCQTSTGILQGIGHIKVPVVGAILGAITKVILNMVLIRIPSINVLGAVLSTTGCYLVAGVFDVIMLSRLTGTKFDIMGSFLKPIIGSAAMAAATLGSYHVFYQLLQSNTIATLLAICIAVAVYGLVMLLIKGNGGEGKSRIGVVMHTLFGANAKNGSIDKVETSAFARADLQHVLVMVDDDTKMEALSSTHYVKSIITAETPMDLERKKEQSFQGEMYVRFMAFSNGDLEALYDKSEGFFRRQLILQTIRKPPGRVDDPYLSDKLKQEAEGIFLWCLDGLRRLQANNYRFTVSKKAAENKEHAKRNANNLVEFLQSEGYIQLKADSTITSRDLYAIYQMWCEDNGYRPIAQRSVSSYLKSHLEDYNLEASNKITNKSGKQVNGFWDIQALTVPIIL